MMTTAIPRAHATLYVCVATAVAVACSSDFLDVPDRAVTLEAIAWPPELHVTDVDTIEIRVRFRDSPQEITGLRVRWQSMNEDVLQLVPANPTGVGREDTLAAQLRAVVTGRSGGSGVVHVAVDAGSGFDPAESTFVIPVTQKWIAVSAGKAHTCGITVDSVAYCWGQGNRGQLGAGPAASKIPVRVLASSELKFLVVSAGDASSCGIIREHVAYCWGSNDEGRLGNGDPLMRERFLPTAISTPAFNALDVGRVVCGLGVDSLAYCWGANAEYQLGHYSGDGALDPCTNANGCSLTPLLVSQPPGAAGAPTMYRVVTVGGHHVCGLSQAPDIAAAYCWGTAPSGALGNQSVTTSPTAVPVTGGFHYLAIVAGGDHTCGIATTGKTYCWGDNTSGQLGNGDSSKVGTPSLETPGSFSSITAGTKHTCALTTAGEGFCWGLGASGQLGNDLTTVQRAPKAVSGGLRFTMLSAGDFHTCGVASDGSLYCWGAGTSGQLGTNDFVDHARPTRVAEP